LGNRGQGYRRLATTYAALGRIDQAASSYAKAVEENESKAEALGEWARMLRENGRSTEGDALLRRAVAADSTDARLRLVFGNYLLQARAFAAAEPELAAAVRWNPSDAAAYAAWGYVALELGDVEGAIQRLRRSIELRSTSPLAHYHLGNAYARQGDRRAAAAEYEAALAVRPGFRPAMEALAELNRR
jgi:tetratricopeptide (TPR) repeat protein